MLNPSESTLSRSYSLLEHSRENGAPGWVKRLRSFTATVTPVATTAGRRRAPATGSLLTVETSGKVKDPETLLRLANEYMGHAAT